MLRTASYSQLDNTIIITSYGSTFLLEVVKTLESVIFYIRPGNITKYIQPRSKEGLQMRASSHVLPVLRSLKYMSGDSCKLQKILQFFAKPQPEIGGGGSLFHISGLLCAPLRGQ